MATMQLTDAVKNAILDAEFQSLYVSLHDGDPGTTGANEISGGSYIRQLETFGAASGGQLVNASDITFNDMPGVTVTYFGLWSADTAGTFIAAAQLVTPVVVVAAQIAFFAAGDLTISIADPA